MTDICQDGTAAGSPTQGVTDDEIQIGVFTDVGFTKNPEFVEAAQIFTSWCNFNGGINGRKIVANIRDAKLMDVRRQMVEACATDFVLVGGGAALDGLGVKERLNCGDNLTRTCIYGEGRSETAWTGGGLHVARDLAEPIPPSPCFNVEVARPKGWETADFGPDVDGLYRCDIPPLKYTSNFSKPMTLADVGKTMADIE